MAQQPAGHHHLGRHAVGFGDFRDHRRDAADPLAVLVGRAPAQVPVGHGRPCLGGHSAGTVPFKRAVGRVAGARLALLRHHAAVQQAGPQQAEFDLVGHRREAGLAVQVEQRRREVGHPEVHHLAAGVQLGERGQDLLRLGQQVRPVQQQDVDVFGPEPPQAALHRGDDVFPGKIEPVRIAGMRFIGKADPALGLDDERLALHPHLADQLPEQFLAAAAAIDVGMVEKVPAELERRLQRRPRPLRRLLRDRLPDAPTAAEVHATERQPGGIEAGRQRVAQGQSFVAGESGQGCHTGFISRRAAAVKPPPRGLGGGCGCTNANTG